MDLGSCSALLACLLAVSPLQDQPAQQDQPSQDQAGSDARQGSQGQGRGGFAAGMRSFGASGTVVRAADLDGNDLTEADEWQAFLASLEPAVDGKVSRSKLKAALFRHRFDHNNDDVLTPEDLQLLYDAVDGAGNADGSIDAKELLLEGAGNAAWRLFVPSLAVAAADADGSGDIPEDEWYAFMDGLDVDPDGTITDAEVVRWLEAAQTNVPADRNAFTPSVFLLTVMADLDKDRNGAMTVSDLEAHFAALDSDQNGMISRAERFARPSRNSGSTASSGGTSADNTRPSRRSGRRDRSRPPLMPWQRTLEDALIEVERTGKPLLICVNMDGEMASESLAWSRYRDPEFVELAQGFVPLLASPDRRNQRDYDDMGRRIADEKFGRVINAEHIDVEPELYKRFFNGQRVAPRHLAVDKDGNTLFDIFLVNDLTAVDEALRKHGKPVAEVSDPAGMDEQSLLASPNALHREYLEKTFFEGDDRTRVRLASLAFSSVRATQHPDILHMALRDPAESVRLQAVWTIVQHPGKAPVSLYSQAFSAAADEPEARGALVDALGRLARATDDEKVRNRALRLQRGFAGAGMESEILDVGRWNVALSWAASVQDSIETQSGALAERLGRLEQKLAASPDDRELNLAFAALSMRYAHAQIREGRNPMFLLEDVLESAKHATSEDDPDGRALAYLAWASYMVSDMEGAGRYAEQAAPRLVPWAGSPLAAKLLEILANTRTRAVYTALGEDAAWPSEWVADISAAYEILLEHPVGTENHVVAYLDFLNTIEVTAPQEDVLRVALERYPTSGRLHAYLRSQVLRDRGAVALEATYPALEPKADLVSTFDWYEGLALLVAAERHVENKDRDAALLAYSNSVAKFRNSTEHRPEYGASADHYICLALSGKARIFADSKNWEDAVASLQEGIGANPGSAAFPDGLGNTPSENARYVYRALVDSGHGKEAKVLRTFLTDNGVRMEG